jgi:predicted DCC family thiol-disulfide oxidoreductase YuxK
MKPNDTIQHSWHEPTDEGYSGGTVTFEADDEGLPDRDTLLRQLHLQTADGKLLTGVEANVAAWRHTRWSFLFAWMEWPLIRIMSSAAYAHWAAWRYRRLYGEQYQESRDAV